MIMSVLFLGLVDVGLTSVNIVQAKESPFDIRITVETRHGVSKCAAQKEQIDAADDPDREGGIQKRGIIATPALRHREADPHV